MESTNPTEPLSELLRKKPELLTRYGDAIEGQLRCFDRVIVHGLLVDVCTPGALANYLLRSGRRPADLEAFALPLNNQIRDNTILLARQHGVKIEYVQRKNFRFEDRVAGILKERGAHPGLVHIFSAKERATVFETRKSKQTGHVTLIQRSGCCVHYYFYLIHEQLGLVYVRVPTWLPFRVQIYLNGHELLARQLDRQNIAYEKIDNAFIHIASWARAQALADSFEPKQLHRWLDELARTYCPPIEQFPRGYHWSFMQAEYAWDVVFKDPATMANLFETLSREAIHTVRADEVGRFFGKRLPHGHDTRVDSDLGRRVDSFRLRHHMGPTGLKFYTKHHRIFRLECTTNDVSFFQHYREVVHNNGTREMKVAAMKKSIYSLEALRVVMLAALRRYLEWLGTLSEHSSAQNELNRLGESQKDAHQRSHRGFNLLREQERSLFIAILRGEFAAGGFSNRRLRPLLGGRSPGQVSRLIKRLRVHGLLKRVGRTYRYYVTKLGQKLCMAALRLHETITVPTLSAAPTCAPAP